MVGFVPRGRLPSLFVEVVPSSRVSSVNHSQAIAIICTKGMVRGTLCTPSFGYRFSRIVSHDINIDPQGLSGGRKFTVLRVVVR